VNVTVSGATEDGWIYIATLQLLMMSH